MNSIVASSNIVGIIDMDGFMVGKKFLCRKIGLIAKGETVGTSIHVKVDKREGKNQKAADIANMYYVQKYIHGLSFENRKGESYRNAVRGVKSFYTLNRISGESLMAYKGGYVEKKLLDSLNIPNINLETLGCPKAVNIYPHLSALRKKHGQKNLLKSCRQHRLLRKKSAAYKHCPKVEVEAFLFWLKNNIEKYTTKSS